MKCRVHQTTAVLRLGPDTGRAASRSWPHASGGNPEFVANVGFEPVLPLLEIRLPRWAQLLRAIHFLRDIRNLIGFVADETEQRRGERPADLGVVHALQSVAVGTGGYFSGSSRRSSPMWLLGWMRLSKHAKAHVYLPANCTAAVLSGRIIALISLVAFQLELGRIGVSHQLNLLEQSRGYFLDPGEDLIDMETLRV